MGRIADIYRSTRKRPDFAWNLYVCRPIAAVVVRLVEHSRITPNQITLSSLFVCAIGVGVLLAVPGFWGLALGILIYEASYVLDCADGMLARLRQIQSVPGHLLDFLMDEIKAFAMLAALAARLYLERQELIFLYLGLVGLVCLATGTSITTFQRRPEIAPPEVPGSSRPKSVLARFVGLAESVAKLMIHYPSYIWLAAVFGRAEIYLYPYIAVNAAYAARALLSVTLRFGRAG